MPDRTIVITGATDGLGRALSGALAHRPTTTLILHGRDQSRLDELATTLADAAGDRTGRTRAEPAADTAKPHGTVVTTGGDFSCRSNCIKPFSS
jgi:short-subunit dehydrogenase